MNSTLTVTPQEVHYRKVGDKVETQESATISWSTSNAPHVSVDPLGATQGSGSQSVTPTPQQTTPGPVDETLSYKLTATNDCGGSETRTASLHLTGSIEAAMGGAEAGEQLGLVLRQSGPAFGQGTQIFRQFSSAVKAIFRMAGDAMMQIIAQQ